MGPPISTISQIFSLRFLINFKRPQRTVILSLLQKFTVEYTENESCLILYNQGGGQSFSRGSRVLDVPPRGRVSLTH